MVSAMLYLIGHDADSLQQPLFIVVLLVKTQCTPRITSDYAFQLKTRPSRCTHSTLFEFFNLAVPQPCLCCCKMLICHASVACQNGYRYRRNSFAAWQWWSNHSSFFRTKPISRDRQRGHYTQVYRKKSLSMIPQLMLTDKVHHRSIKQQ